MPTHSTDDGTHESRTRPPKPKAETGGLQRHVLDLQRQAGNAATAARLASDPAMPVQRHTLDPDHADQDG